MHALLAVLKLGRNTGGTKGQFSNIEIGILFHTLSVLTAECFVSLRPSDHTSAHNPLSLTDSEQHFCTVRITR